jgi:predicted transcriptional regulator of viral defense system
VLKKAFWRNIMRYLEFREALKNFTIFSLNEIKKIDNCFHRRRLNEWQDKGYIKKIIRGYYIFSDLELNENVLFEIANKIYNPSYISFEMALSYYNLIPESVYGITSATTQKTNNFSTSIANFQYRRIKPDLFWAYGVKNVNGKAFKIASIEKAILDYFYLNPGIQTISDFESLRINSETFLDLVNKKELLVFLERFSQKRLNTTINSFLEFIKNA